MFDKILIANRGEIACRVIRTCRRMGIASVAVFSEADSDALHVRMADEAVLIGPAAAAESYLRSDKIIEAARSTGAQAIHPGFGFLSENAEFVKAVAKAGLVFIGPPADAIAAMGDKIQSKTLAEKAGVNTVPGHVGDISDADTAISIAADVGYPVMIKASAGGGGKGMRIARNDQEVRDGFSSARNEAKSSFGDDRIFIERYVEEPRHIEIQVLADGKTAPLYLWERECSIQRRHQKVIEEAPSPFLDEKTRKAMGEQACQLAAAVDYHSAGTVEFIVDKDRNFFFLEMNTRLQVEHPVTEMITGLDLVEWMIRIAAGETLDFGQKDLKRQGWAVETRVYAEDPARNFLPSIGRLRRYQEPATGRDVRVDSGVDEGSEITMFYDPMIAKLVTWGTDRRAAVARMQTALDSFYVRGINHNMNFLSAVMAHPRFREGNITTNFIAEEFADGFSGRELREDERRRLAAVAAFIDWRRQECHGTPMHAAERVVRVGQEQYAFALERAEKGIRATSTEGTTTIEGDWRPGWPLFNGEVDGTALTVQVDRRGPALVLSHDGSVLEALVMRPRVAELARTIPEKAAPDLSRYLLSPMPGLLVSVKVETGQEVKAGEELAVVEAMKMENVLRAVSDGTVVKIHAQPGESLSVDQAIIEFEELPAN
ncbi:acetyl-CoA carboxylase biotin carboxylase subunit [Fodinicurvata halophila]|uniref:propionyl-CoA carboxylase n=1 Tax=Fodinicurvata halophila TaxID=1419723 RepID=A0ABV8UP76_9PROT